MRERAERLVGDSAGRSECTLRCALFMMPCSCGALSHTGLTTTQILFVVIGSFAILLIACFSTYHVSSQKWQHQNLKKLRKQHDREKKRLESENANLGATEPPIPDAGAGGDVALGFVQLSRGLRASPGSSTSGYGTAAGSHHPRPAARQARKSLPAALMLDRKFETLQREVRKKATVEEVTDEQVAATDLKGWSLDDLMQIATAEGNGRSQAYLNQLKLDLAKAAELRRAASKQAARRSVASLITNSHDEDGRLRPKRRPRNKQSQRSRSPTARGYSGDRDSGDYDLAAEPPLFD